MISTRNLSPLPDVDRLSIAPGAMARALVSCVGTGSTVSTPSIRSGPQVSRWGRCGTARGTTSSPSSAPTAVSSRGSPTLPMSPYRSTPKRPWLGVLESVPKEFATYLREPAFKIEDTTFCIWRRYDDTSWQRGPIEFRQAMIPTARSTSFASTAAESTWTAGLSRLSRFPLRHTVRQFVLPTTDERTDRRTTPDNALPGLGELDGCS